MPDDPDRSTLEAAAWIFVTVASLKPLIAKRIYARGGRGKTKFVSLDYDVPLVQYFFCIRFAFDSTTYTAPVQRKSQIFLTACVPLSVLDIFTGQVSCMILHDAKEWP